jgi:hypothetical protein
MPREDGVINIGLSKPMEALFSIVLKATLRGVHRLILRRDRRYQLPGHFGLKKVLLSNERKLAYNFGKKFSNTPMETNRI